MKPITVDYSSEIIILSSAFKKKAFTPGTPEYATLMSVRNDFPGFKLETREFKKNTKQEHYHGLTYEYMRWYIERTEDKESVQTVLSAFEKLLEISKGHSKGRRYPIVKGWFLKRYPDFAEFGMTDKELGKYHEWVKKMNNREENQKSSKENSNVTQFPATGTDG